MPNASAKRLTQEDRERFDGYVDTFDSLRVRQERKTALKDRIAKSAPEYAEDKYTSMQHMDRMEAQFELGASALVAGLTNVITLRPDTLGTLYGGLGFQSLGLHAIGHGATLPSGMNSYQMRKQVDAYHMGLVAKMAQTFDKIPEGKRHDVGQHLDRLPQLRRRQTPWRKYRLAGCSLSAAAATNSNLGSISNSRATKNTATKLWATSTSVSFPPAELETGDHFGQIDPALRDLDLKGPISELLS